MFNKACVCVCVFVCARGKGAKAEESVDRTYVDFQKR